MGGVGSTVVVPENVFGCEKGLDDNVVDVGFDAVHVVACSVHRFTLRPTIRIVGGLLLCTTSTLKTGEERPVLRRYGRLQDKEHDDD